MALLKAGESRDAIAGKLGKTLDSVEHKVRRLGLKEGGAEKLAPSSSFTLPSEAVLPKELPTTEDALRILAWAMEAARRGELPKDRAWQVQLLVKAVPAYVKVLSWYQNIRRMEERLENQEKEIEELKKRSEKTQNQ